MEFGTKDFCNVKTWVTFVGYGRSGHSFIGSALDAHPRICITHEADALRRSDELGSKQKLFEMMYEHEKAAVDQGRLTDNRWGAPYVQLMEGQRKLDPNVIEVIGNKNASIDTQHDKDAFDFRMKSFQGFLGADIDYKYIAVLRNPYDAGLLKEENYSILQSIADTYGNDLHIVHHESFIENPRKELGDLVSFLGQAIDLKHLSVVEKHTMKSPHKARYKIAYSNEEIKRLQRCIDANPIFKGYTYDS